MSGLQTNRLPRLEKTLSMESAAHRSKCGRLRHRASDKRKSQTARPLPAILRDPAGAPVRVCQSRVKARWRSRAAAEESGRVWKGKPTPANDRRELAEDTIAAIAWLRSCRVAKVHAAAPRELYREPDAARNADPPAAGSSPQIL